MTTGIVVLGHGCRAAVGDANDVIDKLVEMMKEKTRIANIEAAFMNPKSLRQSLQQAIDKVIAGGATRVIVVPAFLANGMHIRYDIPEELAAAREKHQGVEIFFASHMGADHRIVDILIERVMEVS